eukprot:scaffold55641_cov27-Prasinocladus_malaysianus.AAC.1
MPFAINKGMLSFKGWTANVGGEIASGLTMVFASMERDGLSPVNLHGHFQRLDFPMKHFALLNNKKSCLICDGLHVSSEAIGDWMSLEVDPVAVIIAGRCAMLFARINAMTLIKSVDFFEAFQPPGFALDSGATKPPLVLTRA